MRGRSENTRSVKDCERFLLSLDGLEKKREAVDYARFNSEAFSDSVTIERWPA